MYVCCPDFIGVVNPAIAGSIFRRPQFIKYYKKNFLSIFLNNKIDTFEDIIKSDNSCKNGLDIKNLEY
jgi:hypothetical protein